MLKITVKNLQRKAAIPPCAVEKIIKRVLKKEGFRGNADITVSFVNDAVISRLNKLYLRKGLPTDVLAFNSTPDFDRSKLYAEIIVSADTARHNAEIFNTSCAYELRLYLIHGLLHLLGYDHKLKKEDKKMREKEKKYVHT